MEMQLDVGLQLVRENSGAFGEIAAMMMIAGMAACGQQMVVQASEYDDLVDTLSELVRYQADLILQELFLEGIL